ncbi:zinc-dependent peptidase [Gelidibacter maritimus]|uniref:Zinc-dependent peptidase n=1 Tax=Gelidibacter maritimus TaxID=2761487 RepID=A0A7W2M660_9FLAO|nr:zinc-dependent peptidase [Gelidibacter maritimus]MBA6153436.1 zinc-dependent peptidase [Gelidibacter maritimus]
MSALFIINEISTEGQIILGVLIFLIVSLLLFYGFRALELVYVLLRKRPFFVYYPFYLKRLNARHRSILQTQFPFYNKLSPNQKKHFEHRVAQFIIRKKIIGRENLVVTDEMKVLIAATGVMLTFGFRDYKIALMERIFIYPDVFYSPQNEAYHKGEFNPKFKSLVLSWKHFVKGYTYGDDNVNLGIHEFAHAIHLNSIKQNDVSATIFSDTFKALMGLLSKDETLRKELIASDYFRAYAYTNAYEFIAVLLETFIETPQELKLQFPEIYNLTK